jgi:branched-chain amino acid transport system permease protein
MGKNSRETIITAFFLIAFFALVIYLEQVIDPRGTWSMLLTVLKKSSVYALVAVSMNLLNGFTGLFSLGHAGFMLIGAYTYAIVSIPLAAKVNVYRYYDTTFTFPPEFIERITGFRFEPVQWQIFSIPEVLESYMGGPGMVLGVLLAIILAGLFTAGVAFFIGLPVLRLKSDYLAIATLGFAEIIRAIFQWGKLGPITNGSNPLRMYVRQNAFVVKIGDASYGLSTFFFVFASAICISIIVLLVNSSYGRAFKAIREDDIAAEAMGINLYRHKQLSFCVSSFFTGVGGAMLAIFMGSVMANNFKAQMTYEILLIVVLGGIGSISGSIIGATLFVFASEWWLRGLDSGTFMGISSAMFRSGFRLVVFSVIIMLVVLFFRKGIMGNKELPYMVKQLFAREPKAGESNG